MIHIKRIDEFISMDNNQNILLEMARIDDPQKHQLTNKKSIYVYGGDRKPMTPHFHYYLDGSKSVYLEISIRDLRIVHSTPRNGVDENKLLTWYKLSKEQEELEKWLKQPNADYPDLTNYIVIANSWNQNNRDNQINVSELNLDNAIKNLKQQD